MITVEPTYSGVLEFNWGLSPDTQFVFNLHANASGNSCTIQMDGPGGNPPGALDFFILQIEGSTTVALPSIPSLQWIGGVAPVLSTAAGKTDWLRVTWNVGALGPIGQIMAIGLNT